MIPTISRSSSPALRLRLETSCAPLRRASELCRRTLVPLLLLLLLQPHRRRKEEGSYSTVVLEVGSSDVS